MIINCPTFVVTRRIGMILCSFLTMALFHGCKTTESPVVVQEEDVMLFLEPGLRPEQVLFPEYLLMEDLELRAHGRIPESSMIGGGLRTDLDLGEVRSRFSDLLAEKKWTIVKTELARESFRLMAEWKGETLEIRAVQGSGPTQIFILYKPAPVNLD